MTAAVSDPLLSAKDALTLSEYLRRESPYRWKRMQKDFAWAQKKLAKAGVNPEQLRLLL